MGDKVHVPADPASPQFCHTGLHHAGLQAPDITAPSLYTA